jgi:hypothetical protein
MLNRLEPTVLILKEREGSADFYYRGEGCNDFRVFLLLRVKRLSEREPDQAAEALQ